MTVVMQERMQERVPAPPAKTRRSVHSQITRVVEPYCTVSEAAEQLVITTGAVYIAMKQGRLRWRYEGGHKVINVQDVEVYPRSVQAETQQRMKRIRELG